MRKSSNCNQITVVSATNNEYLVPLIVMIQSLLESLPKQIIVDFRIMTTGLNSKAKKLLAEVFSERNIKLQEIIVNSTLLIGFKLDGHISIETYFRILIPFYITDVDRVLYLDADTIVCQSVLEFYHSTFEGAHILAVPHISKASAFFASDRGVPSYTDLGIPGDTRVFNAGVMLLNLNLWNKTNIGAKIIRYLQDFRSQVLWWDQDGLNAILHDKWRALDAKWNVMTSHLASFESWEDSLLEEETFESILRNPGIIHYSFIPKPWHQQYSGPFAEYWYENYGMIASYLEQNTKTK